MTAGIAAAEVTFSGTAKFGYNDTDHTSGASASNPFSDMDLNIAFSKELDNGYTPAASVDARIPMRTKATISLPLTL